MSGPRPLGLLALLIVASLLLPTNLFAVVVSAQGADETVVNEWVEVQFDITFSSFSDITVKVRYDIYEADLGLTYGVPASMFRSHLDSDPGIKQEYLDEAEADLRETINGTLGSLNLQNATVTLTPATVLSMGVNVTGDPYREPVSIVTSGKVTINPACLGLMPGASVDDLVRGTLKMGGILNLSVTLHAKAGHLNKFHIVPPAGFYFKAGLALTGTRDLSVDARPSSTEITEKTYLALVAASPADLKDRIDALADVDVKDLDEVVLSVNLSIYAVDSTKVSPYFPGVLGIYLVSSDGLRMAVAQGVLSWEDIRTLSVQPQIDALQSQLSVMLSGPLSLKFQWDNSSLEGYDVSSMTGRPVRATLTGSGALDMKGMSKHIAQDALWSGAKVPFQIGIYNDLNWSVKMTLPQNLTLEGTGLAPSGTINGRETYRWNKAYNPLKGDIARNGTWVPDHNGSVNIRIEVLSVDYDLIRVLAQHQTTLKFRVSVTIALDGLTLDSDLRKGLPGNVTLERANADLIRALIADGKVERAKIDDMVDDLSVKLQMQMAAALDRDVDFRVFLDEHSLDKNATGPILMKGSATISVEKDLNSKNSLISFLDTSKTFYLQGKEGWIVTYTIMLPKGIEIYKVTRSLKQTDFKQQPMVSKDKRSLVEVLDGDQDDNVTIYVKPTFDKTLSVIIVQPLCILSIVLVIVAIIGAVYMWRVYKRKARLKAMAPRKHRVQPPPVRIRERSRGAEMLERDGQHIDKYHKLQPHLHQHRLPLKTWKSEEGTDEDIPTPRAPVHRTPPTRPPKPVHVGDVMEAPVPRAMVPLAQPKPYLPQKPAAPVQPKHVTGGQERFVTCPSCKRRFSVHPEAEALECPHCGKKGKTAPKKPHIIGPQPASKAIRCPRCGNAIVYNEGQENIRCSKCGKEGKVKKKA
jgi:predicted RNA-binding Zn-ribbon protein involved in translation (DUF1610 family)